MDSHDATARPVPGPPAQSPSPLEDRRHPATVQALALLDTLAGDEVDSHVEVFEQVHGLLSRALAEQPGH